MKRRIALISFGFLLSIGMKGQNTFGSVSQSERDRSKSAIDQIDRLSNSGSIHHKPFGFQENKGQMADIEGKPVPYVLFKAEAPNLNIWITTTGLTYQFFKFEEESEKQGEEKVEGKWHRVDMVLKNANINWENVVSEGDITQGDVNYYLGHCPKGIFNVKTYTKITIKNVYPKIDWVLYTFNGGLKHDFIVQPNANPNQIKLIYEGSGKLNLTNSQIHFKNELGEITEGKLLCYQENNLRAISSEYVAKETGIKIKKGFSHEVGIKIDDYNRNEPLIIDPQLIWGTYFGGNGIDGVCSVASDALGNLFASGYTNSPNFPTLNPLGGAYFQSVMGNFDIFLVKFNNNGVWIWATYYGGSGGGGASRWATIALDGSNNLFVTGRTNCTNFPVLNLAGAYFQPAISGIQDAFILKFNNNGILLWATYYGGSGDDQGYSIAIDASDDVLVTGSTSSVNFPVLNLAAAYNQPGSAGVQDAFILKFNNNGLRLWSTYYGGSGDDLSYSIAIDNANNILITGSATSVNLPVLNLAGAYNQPGNAGGQDAFVAKFNGSGVQLWATYYGGSGTDQGCSVAIDAADNVFVVGNTSSANLPLLNLSGAYNQPGFAGVQDVFILKFNSSGVRLWATYFGGNSIDFFRNYTDHEITIDVCGNLYITGGTNSTDFPVLNPGCGSHFQGTYAGGNPYGIFFLKFSNNGILLWSTHSGASALGFGSALAIDISGNLFAVGEWFYSGSNGLIDPGGGAYFDATFNTSDDSYMMKFIPLVSAYTQTQINSTGCSPCNGSATINLTCSEPNFSYTWSNGSSTLNSVSSINTITGLCPGTYTVTATSNCNQTQTATFVITGTPCATCTLTGQFTNGTANCAGCGCKQWVMVNATGGTSPYFYSWPDGYDKRYKNQLCPGTYIINIKDKSGCSINVSIATP